MKTSHRNFKRLLHRWGEVLTPFVANQSWTTDNDLGSETGDVAIHDRHVELLQRCHVVVAEVASPGQGQHVHAVDQSDICCR